MLELSIDIETYSSVDLVKSGVYAYVNAPDFSILLFAYSFDEDPVSVVDLARGDKLPITVMKALTDERYIKTAYNANFERTCITKYFGLYQEPRQWRCSAVAAAELGLPQSLAAVAGALGLEQQKDARGKALIKYFSCPCKPSKANGGRTRNQPEHDPEKWNDFIEYCRQDVVVEQAIKKKISRFPMKDSEQKLWEVDQKINDAGVRVDLDFVEKAIIFSEAYKEKCVQRATTLTELENVNSVTQLKKWIEERTGQTIASLNKEAVQEILATNKDPLVLEVIRLRSEMAKTSVAKYDALARSICPDNRVRGIMQFYGAGRTGRWAGRIFQPQNLPQNHLSRIDFVRSMVEYGDFELFELLYGNVPQTLSELIRTSLIPSKGRRFIVADFSAIEARVVAYLAGEQWRLNIFEQGGDIYCASASQMFKVPVEKHGVNSHLRQKGKVAELALGYGGGPVAMLNMGALKQGLTEEELPEIVSKWREASPAIVQFWYDVEKAAKNAMKDKPSTLPRGLSFIKQSGILFIGLPSGRRLAYVKPQMGENKWGNPAITYMGNDAQGRWTRIETFGGKLVENIVQAVARDCLAESIMKLEEKGFEINFHVHDEVILDVPIGTSSVEEVTNIMGEPVPWAEELPLRADGYECEFYMKD